ncbi:MAG: hypothetical protein A2Y21_02805 [Clostridiales bacterium GWC2_40_7]|nr:MAG: hypothetical protein A2Y21_02805 [Clostridiales bacterium GWC2_40_7]
MKKFSLDWMRNISIRTKYYGVLLLTILLFLVSTLIVFSYLRNINQNMLVLNRLNDESVKLSEMFLF